MRNRAHNPGGSKPFFKYPCRVFSNGDAMSDTSSGGGSDALTVATDELNSWIDPAIWFGAFLWFAATLSGWFIDGTWYGLATFILACLLACAGAFLLALAEPIRRGIDYTWGVGTRGGK